jgi:hypothetical protein
LLAIQLDELGGLLSFELSAAFEATSRRLCMSRVGHVFAQALQSIQQP